MDWGQTIDFGDDVFGVYMLDGEYRYLDEVKAATESFLTSYWNNAKYLVPNAHITLVVGVNSVEGTQGAQEYAHGYAWEGMINELNNWVNTNNGMRAAVNVWAGSDIEQDPANGWATPTEVQSWISGYSAHYGTDQWPFVDYGSADGCPPASPNCQGVWTQLDIFNVAYGDAPSWPMPDIYNSTLAAQWQSIAENLAAMDFLASVSQYSECVLHFDPLTCPGNDQLPASSWQQLWVLANSYRTSPDYISWSTDIEIYPAGGF